MRPAVHEKPVSRSVDRRVLRTREAVTRAFVGLMRRKRYDDISVEEICCAAGVGRSTFYLHYADKNDLKRRGFEAHLREHLAAQLDCGETADPVLAFSLPILPPRWGKLCALFRAGRRAW